MEFNPQDFEIHYLHFKKEGEILDVSKDLSDQIEVSSINKIIHPDDGLILGKKYTFRLVLKDGSFRWFLGKFLEHEKGTIRGLFQDIHTIKQNEEKFALVLEGTRLGMWDWYPSTNEVIFDERWAQMLGHDLKEISFNYESWASRVHPDDIDSCLEDIKKHMEGKVGFYENVHRMMHKDGEWRYILDRGKICERDLEGNPIRFTGTHTDITREKVAEQKALLAVKSNKLFLSMMSHDLRNPLKGILGLTDILLMKEGLEDYHEDLEIIKELGKSLLRLIEDILLISKLENYKCSLEEEPFQISKLLQVLSLSFTGREELNTIELKIENNLEDDIFLGDEFRISEILSNFIDNAFKNTKNGFIKLSVNQELVKNGTNMISFTIQDTGKGFDEALLPDLLKPFSQISDLDEVYKKGLGLGLSINNSLIELMKGKLEIHSDIGEGTIVKALIPLKKGSVDDLRIESTDTIPRKNFSDLKVLFMDDNSINLLVLEKKLITLGVQKENISLLDNVSTAIKKCQDQRFDIIFIDFFMPGSGGKDFLNLIENTPNNNTPIVIHSAHESDEEILTCQKNQPLDFLPKPSSIEDLKKLLHRNFSN